ncbi:hypothetical protein ACR6C2_15165 [Streptomyces sp. INA 01156]
MLALVAVGLLAAPAGYAGEADATPAGHSRGTASGSLEVYPSSVVAGAQVTVNTAACGDHDTVAGDATAVGAGRFTLMPSAHERDSIGQFRCRRTRGRDVRDRREMLRRRAAVDRRPGGPADVRGPAGSSARKCEDGGRQCPGPRPVQTAAGVAALAVAAAGGTWLLHRRARGDGI